MPPPTLLTVLHEDDSLLAVSKPAGLPVHGSGGGEETVETVLRRQLGGRAVRMGFTITAAHRLDRDTSGVLVLARRKRAARRLMEAFASGAVEKTYLALVLKGPPDDAGVIDKPLPDLDRKDRAPQEAATAYRVLARTAEATLVECRPKTGRTHQIRRHLAALGCPLAGDPRYGSDRFNAHARAEWGLDRLFLHAASLVLPHPDDDTPLRLDAPLAPELVAVLERLGIKGPVTTAGT